MNMALHFPSSFIRWIALVLLAVPQVSATTVWVAKDGLDTADGMAQHPFATLERARMAIREALQRGESGEVVIRRGTYELREPLTLGAADSGTADAPVVWRGAPGEEVRLSGGRSIDGWCPVEEPAILKHLESATRDSVFQVDLRAQGIIDYGTMSGGFATTNSTGLELFVDDQPTQPSRYPHEGYLTLAQPLGPTSGAGSDAAERKATKEGIFRVDDPRVGRWVHEQDAQVLGYWCFDWAEQRQRIVSIDPAKQVITLGEPWHQFGYRAGQNFYVYNLLSELGGQPGEWCLDRQRGVLYFCAPQGAPARAMVTLLPSVVVMEGARHVTLSHLIFEGERGDAVRLLRCESCQVERSVLRNGGGWGVQVEDGHGCTVTACTLYHNGEGGVSLKGGDRRTLTPGGHAVVNCEIHDYARWARTYQPGIRLAGVGCRAAHNLIYNAPHQGMSFEGNDHVIEYNEIHDVCQESNDAGAIYAWNDWAGRGNLIRYNFLHHVFGKEHKGANGIYLDDNFSAATIEGNVFAAMTRPVFLGGGRDHQIRNNLFVDCHPALHIDARGLDWRSGGFEELKAKLLPWPYRQPPWSDRYPGLPCILEDEPMAPKGIIVEKNVLIDSPGDDIDAKARPFLTLKDNLPDAPHILLEGGSGVPHLKTPALEAEAIGFETIPWEKIGLFRTE